MLFLKKIIYQILFASKWIYLVYMLNHFSLTDGEMLDLPEAIFLNKKSCDQ